MQVITIAGNIGHDAEVRTIQGGDVVASFTIAVNEGKKANGEEPPPTWYRVSVWGKRGEKLAPYLTKGSRVTVMGAFRAGMYEDKNGTMRLNLDIRANEIALQGGGKQEGQQPAARAPAAQQHAERAVAPPAQQQATQQDFGDAYDGPDLAGLPF